MTVDGVEQERTLLNEDTYNASKAIYRVGPAHAAPAPVPEQTAPATTPETAENHTPETAQTEPAQTEAEHKQLQEKWRTGVVPTTAAQPAGIMLVRKARPVPHRRKIHENSRTGSGRI
mgnify:CR=1 FL=1